MTISAEREAQAHADLIAALPPRVIVTVIPDASEMVTELRALMASLWAHPLTRGERWALSVKLARARKRSYDAGRFAADADAMLALTLVSAEMSELHRDVAVAR